MKLKRIMAMVLCVAMVLSTMSLNVFAEDAATVSTYEELVAALGTSKQISLIDDITVETAITVPDDVTIDLNDNTLYVNVENSYYNNVTIKNGDIVLGKDDVHVCDGYFLVNEGKTLVLDSVNMSSAADGIKGYAVFHLKTGANLDLIASTLNISDNEYEEGYIVYAGESTATVDITDATTVTGTNVNGIVHATTVIDKSTFIIDDAVEHGINRSATTINDSTVTISGGTGRGITAQHGDLVISGNSTVDISDMDEATIELRGDMNLTVAATATVTVDTAVNVENGTITGSVTVGGATEPPVVNANVKIGEQGYATLADALEATKDMSGDVVIELLADAELSYGAREAYGKDDTTSITISGNNNTLTLNQTDSDWSSIGMKNAEGEFKMNNVTVNKTGYGSTGGAWNTHAINFNVNTEFENVTFNNSIKVSGTSVLTNVDIVEDEGFYGIWIPADAESVTINGGSITATNGGRGIKIADEYVDAPIEVQLTVDGMTFETAKKAAVLVSSTAGADITTANCDITKVAADSTNFAWVDEEWSSSADKVTVNDESAFVEGTIVISNIDELKAFRDAVNAGTTYEGKFVMLTANIDLAGENWTPIGNGTNYFWGTFDGGNHTISNMTISVNDSTTNQYVGFFGSVKKATIKKLIIKDAIINAVGAKVYVGAVAGQAHSNSEYHTTANLNFENITVDGCTINAESKSASAYVSGFVGYCYPANMTNISVSNLTLNPKASGSVFAGGLVGYMQGQNISNNGNTRAYYTVDTFNLKNITINSETRDSLIGGFAGYTYYGYITLNDATIDGFKVDAELTDSALVGGLIGLAHRSDKGHTFTDVEITNIDFDVTSDSGVDVILGGMVGYSGSPIAYSECSASGTITETTRNAASSAIVGGFIGCAASYTQTYTDSVADVDIEATKYAGGFVGSTYTTATYTNCEAKGTVKAEIAGGFAGYAKNATFKECAYTGESDVPFIAQTDTNVTIYVALVGTEYYKSLAEAITSAQPNDTITLIADVDEDVTIDKNITIDGSDKNYTGTMTLNAANITVQNLNFVGGNIVKGNSTKNGANITIKGCDFDGQNAGDYAVNLRLTGAIVIEDCTAKDYGYGFLQVPKSNNTISVKNVEISGVNYGFKIDYSNNVVFEDVTITDTLYGIMDSNYGPKTYTFKNCNIDATNSLYLWERSAAKTDTFMFVGENNLGTGTVTTSDYAILKLADSDAVLKACEGLTVTSTNEIYSVVYEDGAYKVQKVAKVGENHYYSLQEAIDAANDGDIITLVADIKIVQNVTINKNVVVDLNGHTVNGAILPSNGDITVKNGWIKNTDNGQSAIEINSGKLNLTNVNIESARHAIRIDGDVQAVIDGGTYKVVPVDGKTVHAINVSGNANVVIKNGEFIGPKGTVADSGAAVNVQEGSTVTIEGGTFTGGKNNTLATKGTLAIYGGIYDQDPSAYVVDGYKTSDKANNFYVVYPEFKVSAIVNDPDKTVKAGEEFEVYITVTGGDYTNAGWKLGYDPTKVEYVKAEGGVDAVDYTIVDSVLGEGETSGNEYKNGEVYKKYTFRAKYPSTTVNSVFTIENVYVNNYEMAAWLDKTPAAMEGDTVTITNDLAFGGTIADKEVSYNGMYQKGEAFVANMTGAEVTYSTEENGKYTTEVPAFKDAGEHTYYYKATLAGYTTVTGSAKLTITPATLAPKAEFNVDPDYDTVNVKAVIENLIDNSFKGTVTIEVGGQKVAFEATEFTYDGNGRAIANQFKKVDLTEGKEYAVKVTYTANATGDNYKDATSETTVNPDKKEITSDDLNNIKAALTNSYVYDGVEHFVKVDESNLPGEWKVEIPEIGLTDVGETMVTIKATDASGKYNEHTFNVVLKVTPKDITIVINNASKDLGQADPVFTSNINELLVVADHLGEVKYVREPGEAMGTYKINVTYTPNPNYNVVDIVEGNLYIGAPTDFKVEVVNNKLLKGDDYKQDYIAGYRLVLVYTNVDKAYFTYKGQEMYDVSDAPYEYYDYDFTTMTATKDTTEYKHIYAIVVDAEYGYEDTTENEAMYANNVEFASETAKPEKILYNSDINYTGELDVEDFSITNGVYNVLYRGKAFITRLLKADVNGNKLVDTEDAGMIKEVVVK